MAERGLGVAMRLEPVGCPAMEHGAELGLVLGQLASEQIPKQRVAAVRLAVSVERSEEEVHTVERSEHAPGARRAPARRRRAARSGARASTFAGERSPGRASTARGTRSGSTRPGTDRRLPAPRREEPRRLRVTRARPGGCPRPSPRTARAGPLASSSASPASSSRSSASLSRRLSASSSAPTSSSLPSARSRAIGNPGMRRPTSVSVDPGGTCSASVESAFVELRERSRWALSTTSTKSSLELSRDASRGSSAVRSFGGGRASSRTRSGRGPRRAGRAGRAGSSSASSTDSQANGRRSRSAHCAASVVFPYPAGAIRVTRDADAVRRRFTSGVLDTAQGGGDGTRTFASTTFDGPVAFGRSSSAACQGVWEVGRPAHQRGCTTLSGGLAPGPTWRAPRSRSG